MTPPGAIACPGCGTPMQSLALEHNLHGSVTVDLCGHCQALWFDAFESVALAPVGTLALFRAIHEARSDTRSTLPARLPCPRCTEPLAPTQDLRLTTRFTYFRCRNGHGRFTPFVQFLREKDFIRAVPPHELERLKKLVRVVRCSSCGAPVDLDRDNACSHCRAPIVILDPEAVARTLRELDAAAARRADVPSPQASAAAVIETARFDRAMAAQRAQGRDDRVIDLVAVGFDVLAAIAFR